MISCTRQTLLLHRDNFCAGKISELRDLVNELSTVSQWYLLGIYLGLRQSTLDAIKADNTTVSECRTQMLIQWQRCVIPTWSAVVNGLVGIGRERLASHLATKYGMLHKIPVVCLTHNGINLVPQEFPFRTQLITSIWKKWKSLKQNAKWYENHVHCY